LIIKLIIRLIRFIKFIRLIYDMSKIIDRLKFILLFVNLFIVLFFLSQIIILITKTVTIKLWI